VKILSEIILSSGRLSVIMYSANSFKESSFIFSFALSAGRMVCPKTREADNKKIISENESFTMEFFTECVLRMGFQIYCIIQMPSTQKWL
jgi:hypothetical protein